MASSNADIHILGSQVMVRRLRHACQNALSRWRRSAADLRLILVLSVANIGIYAFTALIDDHLNITVSERLDAALQQAYIFSALQLPCVFIIAIALRFAPRQGFLRWICALAAAILSVLAGNRCAVWIFGSHPHWDHIAVSFGTCAIAVACCFFQGSSRTAESELMRRRIERVSLDAEFNRAQLDLLRAQIEPHFLFNTLATVLSLARSNARGAAELLDHLVVYFAAALPTLRCQQTRLVDEMQLIDAYLRILQVRMGHRLQFQIELPEELRELAVPSVMLLTLVENAIKHGVGPLSAGGHVQVSAHRDQSRLVLNVSDTGRGIQASHGHGSGLANIRTRLALHYGRSAHLRLIQEKDHGLRVTVEIPFQTA